MLILGVFLATSVSEAWGGNPIGNWLQNNTRVGKSLGGYSKHDRDQVNGQQQSPNTIRQVTPASSGAGSQEDFNLCFNYNQGCEKYKFEGGLPVNELNDSYKKPEQRADAGDYSYDTIERGWGGGRVTDCSKCDCENAVAYCMTCCAGKVALDDNTESMFLWQPEGESSRPVQQEPFQRASDETEPLANDFG